MVRTKLNSLMQASNTNNNNPSHYVCRYSDSLRDWAVRGSSSGGTRFSTTLQTGPETHPAFYTTGTAYFPGVKRPGHRIDHSPPSTAEVKEGVELYLYSPSGPSRSVLGWNEPLPFNPPHYSSANAIKFSALTIPPPPKPMPNSALTPKFFLLLHTPNCQPPMLDLHSSLPLPKCRQGSAWGKPQPRDIFCFPL